MSENNEVESKPAPQFLMEFTPVDVNDVQVNDVVTDWPNDGWPYNYYVLSVTDTEVVVHTGFGGSYVKRFLKHECKFERLVCE